ncbi:MAG: hypothetical protein ACM3VW_09595, partial [Bacteroidota bacterium]
AGLNDNALGGTFNIGNDRETTIKELAETMVKVSGRDIPIEYVPQEEVYGKSYEDIQRRVPEITRMREVLGVDPSTSLEDGLKATYDWFLAQQTAEVKQPRAMTMVGR